MIVTVSPGYEVSLPPTLCEKLGIRPGDTLTVVATASGMTLLPSRHPRELRGFLAGMNVDFEREPDRM
jgi:bifunctional DNA-binding transcriptional regulator/antitoxin component of YhaV-PrlF toxin-antitoxin module